MKRNPDYSLDDMDISIVRLLVSILKRWRLLVIIVLIGCLLGGVFQAFRVQNGALVNEQEDYEIEHKDYVLAQSTYTQIISNNDEIILDSQDTLKNSIYLNLDSEHVWTSSVIFNLTIDDSVLVTYNNTAINPFSILARAYIAKLAGDQIPEGKREELIGSGEVDYWNELVTVSELANGRMVEISAKGATQESAAKITDYLSELLLSSSESVSGQVIPHTADKYSESIREDKDPGILTKIQKINESISSSRDKINKAQTELIKMRGQEPFPPGKHIFKFAAIFGFVFGVLGVLLVAVKYLSKGFVQDSMFVQLYDAPLLGTVRVSPEKKNPIDRLIDRIQFRNIPSAESELDSIAAFLMSHSGEGDVILCGTVPEADLQALGSELDKRTKGSPKLNPERGLLQDAKSMERVKGAAGVVVVEKIGASKKQGILSEAEKLMMNELPVLGWIITE